MTQYTKKFVLARFQSLLEETGNTAPAYANGKFRVGAWALDYTACYGGWIIEQYTNEGGAVTHVNGWTNRMSAKELVCWMDGFVYGLAQGKKGE